MWGHLYRIETGSITHSYWIDTSGERDAIHVSRDVAIRILITFFICMAEYSFNWLF